MRKKFGLFTVIFLFSIVLTSCGFHENAAAKKSCDEKKIISTEYINGELYTTYPDMQALANTSELVIYGNVLRQESGALNGQIYTMGEVEVLEVLKGEKAPGDIVRICVGSGVVSVEQYIETLVDEDYISRTRERFSEYPEEEYGNLYISCEALHDIPMEQGQKGIFFLGRGPIEELGVYYNRTNVGSGEYLEVEQDQFVNACELYDMQEIQVSQISDESEEVYFESIEPLSKDQIKKAIGIEENADCISQIKSW